MHSRVTLQSLFLPATTEQKTDLAHSSDANPSPGNRETTGPLAGLDWPHKHKVTRKRMYNCLRFKMAKQALTHWNQHNSNFM